MLYIIKIGLNDKTTKFQMITTEKAKQKLVDYVCNHFDGGTITTCEGIYKHENGAIVIENTLQVELITERENADALCEWAKIEYNQESVMLSEIKCDIFFK